MTGRSPARLLAPLALAGTVVALYLIVTADGSDTQTSTQRSNGARETPGARGGSPSPTPTRTRRRTYVVRPGDTPSTIAEKTGVPLSELLELNPKIDPQLLAPGQRLKLSE